MFKWLVWLIVESGRPGFILGYFGFFSPCGPGDIKKLRTWSKTIWSQSTQMEFKSNVTAAWVKSKLK